MDQRIIEHMSSALYVGLCHEVGTPTIVQMRRDVEDARETILKQSDLLNQNILSGSQREGLDMSGSDFDYMIWPTDEKVTFETSNTNFNINNANGSKKHIYILAVLVHEQPGFFLLRLITNMFKEKLQRALIMIHNDIYISSSLYREECLKLQRKLVNDFFLHGPCCSVKNGNYEVDLAHCISCDEWPTLAVPWIERCKRKGWPSREILNNILSNGCHFVPIGVRNSVCEQHEWRLSFSTAEKILVTSMTHTQFLCYAMLKLFLKEVINIHTTTHLICSYFLKTVLFWELQENRSSALMPSHLLKCVWQCFKHLIKWVYKGDCPNFFIPNNNMFRGKVEGAAQTQLLTDLYKLYKMGISCLLLSPSVRSYLVQAIQNPKMVIDTNEVNDNIHLDREVFSRIAGTSLFVDGDDFNLKSCLSILVNIRKTISLPMTEYKALSYRRLASHVLQCAAFLLIKKSYIPNKQRYIRDKISCGMLKLAARIGDISDLLYLAMYYYKTQRYIKALNCVEITKNRLSHPFVVHEGGLKEENTVLYEETVDGLSFPGKMKKVWSFSNQLIPFCNYINILKEERQFCRNYALLIPSYVMVSLLSFICQHGNPTKQEEALFDLQYLLLNDDDGYYIVDRSRDISWHILGICQQLSGNLYKALYSHQQSLRCEPFHGIQNVTYHRISSVITELQSLRN